MSNDPNRKEMNQQTFTKSTYKGNDKSGNKYVLNRKTNQEYFKQKSKQQRNQLRKMLKIQTEKKSVKKPAVNPNRKEISSDIKRNQIRNDTN